MGKKIDISLEFIMTYGWAILVVLTAIIALVYFGVLAPARFLPSDETEEVNKIYIFGKPTTFNDRISVRNFKNVTNYSCTDSIEVRHFTEKEIGQDIFRFSLNYDYPKGKCNITYIK